MLRHNQSDTITVFKIFFLFDFLSIYLSYNSWCPSPSVYIPWYHIQNSQILNCIAECITSTSQITGVSQSFNFRQFTDLDTELIKWIELLSSLLKIIDKGCQIVEHFQSNYGGLYYNYLKQRCQKPGSSIHIAFYKDSIPSHCMGVRKRENTIEYYIDFINYGNLVRKCLYL